MSKVILLIAWLAATAPYAFHFPRDHAAHDAYRTEWWYFTGHLHTRSGRRFGYELTFFRIGLEPQARKLSAGMSRWRGTELYPAHFAITDEQRGRFVYYEDLAREALGAGSSSEQTLDVHVNAWSLRAYGDRWHLNAGKQGDGLELDLRSAKPPAIHGIGGISRKGACVSCASHYYSFTRLASSGELRVAGSAFAVEGSSWMDHEYGSDELSSQQRGWDWFSVQLDDGRELMLYHLRQRDGTTTPQSSGTLIDRRGATRYLPLRAFSIGVTAWWQSPHTGARYPSGWTIHVAGVGELRIAPRVADQELVNAETGVTYWEGASSVTDRAGKRLGDAYVELTGYAGPVIF